MTVVGGVMVVGGATVVGNVVVGGVGCGCVIVAGVVV